ncbi:MAG TPA: DUF6789 family protein [Xanthobacteraceae bacterium]|nr:DUF6789 family protein [Xanthobacteraceae bacterium]
MGLRRKGAGPEHYAAGMGVETGAARRPGAAMDRIENTIGKGIVAGFVTTFVLSVLLDPIELFAPTVWPTSPAMGWVLHFFIGTVIWGVGFAVLHDYLPGPSWQRGLVFALGAWLVVVGGTAALLWARVLAFDFGATLLIATLVVHVLYGVLLGVIYGWLLDGPEHEPHGNEPHPIVR